AALRSVESPCANAHEVAAPHPSIFERWLNRAKEIFVRWRHFKDDRGPTGVSVVHNNVDLILAERIFVVHHKGCGWCCLLVRDWSRSEEVFEVFIERLFDFLKLLLDLGIAERRCRVC